MSDGSAEGRTSYDFAFAVNWPGLGAVAIRRDRASLRVRAGGPLAREVLMRWREVLTGTLAVWFLLPSRVGAQFTAAARMGWLSGGPGGRGALPGSPLPTLRRHCSHLD